MRVLAWGTFDLGKPRLRLLLQGLGEQGIQVDKCNIDVWGGIEDKSQLSGLARKLSIAWAIAAAYPRLIVRFLRDERPDYVLLGYPAILDCLILWPFARARRVPIVLDSFIGLHNTVVEDRKLISGRNPLSAILHVLEWLALRAATVIITDTDDHAAYFADRYRIRDSKFVTAEVGAEDFFQPAVTSSSNSSPARILFYGQFIPLHGLDTIIRAAALCNESNVIFRIVGKGQEYPRIRELAEKLDCRNVEFVDWIPYESLPDEIMSADICLGIFGTTDKASRVIPNKVFQIVACGRPLVTADTPPVRSFLRDYPWVRFSSPGDAAALVDAIESLRAAPEPEHQSLLAFSQRTRPADTTMKLAERLTKPL